MAENSCVVADNGKFMRVYKGNPFRKGFSMLFNFHVFFLREAEKTVAFNWWNVNPAGPFKDSQPGAQVFCLRSKYGLLEVAAR